MRTVVRDPKGMSLGELARELGLAKSTVQRIVGALAEEGLLISSSAFGGIRIGPEILRLSMAMKFDVSEMLRPFVHRLADQTGETVDVSILDGGSAVFIDQIPGTQRLIAVSSVGERFPLTNNAPGIMLLALSESKVATIALNRSLQEHPTARIEDLESFLKVVAKARKRGYYIDEEQHSEGICAVGTAIPDPAGRPVAISVPMPAIRFARVRSKLVGRILSLRASLEEELDYLHRAK